MTNSSPNNNAQISLQKIMHKWFKLFFTANSKPRYGLIGGLFGVFYGILSNFFPATGIKGVGLVAYIISLFVMIPLSKVLPLSAPSILPLVPSFTSLGGAIFATIYLSIHAGCGAVAGVIIGKLPSRIWRYATVLSLLILWLGFIGLEYYARYTSTRAYKIIEREENRGNALQDNVESGKQNEAPEDTYQATNRTTEFLEQAVKEGSAEIILKDIHGLWDGVDMRVHKEVGAYLWKADVRVVELGKTFEYTHHLRDSDIESLFALFIQEDFLSIALQNYTPVPDEALTRITLINGQKDAFTVDKWQTQTHTGFDRLYEHLLALEKSIRPSPL